MHVYMYMYIPPKYCPLLHVLSSANTPGLFYDEKYVKLHSSKALSFSMHTYWVLLNNPSTALLHYVECRCTVTLEGAEKERETGVITNQDLRASKK